MPAPEPALEHPGFTGAHATLLSNDAVMPVKLLGVLNLISIVSGMLALWAIGIFILQFPEVDLVLPYFMEYFWSLILITVVTQLVMGIAVYKDFNNRIWDDSIKYDLWKKLFFYNSFNYGYVMVMTTYYLVIMRGWFESDWIRTKKQHSIVWRVILSRSFLGTLSTLSSTYLQVFLLLFILGWVAMSVKSVTFALFMLKSVALFLMVMPPSVGLFQQLMMVHMASRKWVDYSFEDFFSKKIIVLPGVAFADYYKTIVKDEMY